MKPKTGILQRSLVVIPPGESSKSRNWWRRLDRTVEQHPEWALEPMQRGPTPISKGWEKSR